MNGYGKRMLIVEHDEDERNLLSLMLENEGFNVYVASEECLALEEMKRRRFDVVMSAHRMPHINGFRLILLLRLAWLQYTYNSFIGGRYEFVRNGRAKRGVRPSSQTLCFQ